MRRGSDVEDGASEEPQPPGKELRNRSKKQLLQMSGWAKKTTSTEECWRENSRSMLVFFFSLFFFGSP
jgi:hypothetical protein